MNNMEHETTVCKRILDKELERFKKKSIYEKRDYLSFEIPWLMSRVSHREDEAKVPTIEEERLVYRNLVKNTFFYKETLSKPLNVESTYDLLNELTRQNLLIMMQDLWEMKVKRGEYYTIPEKKAPYYVSIVFKGASYHPAEGGIYLEGTHVSSVREFSTYKKAMRYMRKLLKETNWEEEESQLEGYGRVPTHHYVDKDHKAFGCYSGYIGDGWDIYMTRHPLHDTQEHYC